MLFKLLNSQNLSTQSLNSTGHWKSNFGDMVLIKEGNYINGFYSLKDGLIKGVLKNNVLTGYWFDQNTDSNKKTGKVILYFNNNSFKGKWNYLNHTPKYNWNGSLISHELVKNCQRYRVIHDSPNIPTIKIKDYSIEYKESSSYYYPTSCLHSINIVLNILGEKYSKNIPLNVGCSYSLYIKGKLPDIEIDVKDDYLITKPTNISSVHIAESIIDISGIWDSNWGEINFIQSDHDVAGQYTLEDETGDISGVLSKNILTGSWQGISITRPLSDVGKLRLEFTDNNTFSGTWGYNTSFGNVINGYIWEGRRRIIE